PCPFHRCLRAPRPAHSCPTRRSSDLFQSDAGTLTLSGNINGNAAGRDLAIDGAGNITLTGVLGTNVGADSTNSLVKTGSGTLTRSEEHTFELQSREKLVCRLLLEKNT